MDHSTYIAMTGASQIMQAQSEVANNLANANTVGFKSELSAFKALPVQGEGAASRINSVDRGAGWDMSAGPTVATGRDLDVAVRGQGWIAVQAPDGSEGYTRAGNLKIDASGLLTDARGNPVLGDGGPISVPPAGHVSIGKDGTVSLVPLGESPSTIATVGRIKLVNPPADQLQLRGDSLMHLRDGGSAPADADVTVESKALEQSNVNPTDMLVRMIQLSRQFEMQVRSIHTADQDAQASSKLLDLNG